MILTGSAIDSAVGEGQIVITPYDQRQLNPNSYNYRLGRTLLVPRAAGDSIDIEYEELTIPESGYRLEPGRTYLGHTYEILGSDVFAMSLIGRSSIGRLGLFLQVSANLGHVGSCHRWTLELVSAKPFILYPEMKIGQISFWHVDGHSNAYLSGYSQFNKPEISRLSKK
ncbi:dCTP deaminase [Burkholderia lata]|uniref:dCTP deaminase n=1 Tax=Burkholderia lata (strain ATCC 17760 / DSM 23089 / LMG 22485 / NCIMB 9086 / R18194 / 383) TaxID=482957 RepID=A0A6P2NVQ2_BURL3|nr:deoxycytidine deaminase [Burkholderia lata]VWB98947.1 dCTP deaminase [Burkholderia lata]